MKMTDALLGEHGVFYALFDRLEQSVRENDGLSEVQRQAALVAAALKPHARLENDLLFTALEPELGQMGPLAVMREEHNDIENALDRVQESQDLGEARNLVIYAIEVARQHFAKEEQVLFPMARQTLDAAALEDLGAQWARHRRVHVG